MLRKINKWATKIYVMLPMVGLFTFVSCKKESHAPSVQQSAQAQNTVNSIAKLRNNFTDADYLKGIFFVSGPVADLIPELANLKVVNFVTDKAVLEYIALQENKIVDALNKQNPTFLAHFKTEITSGDQVRIKMAIMEASAELKPVFESFYNLNDKDVQKKIDASVAELKANKNFTADDINKTKTAIKDFLRTQGPTSTDGKCNVAVLAWAVAAVAVFVFAVAVLSSYAIAGSSTRNNSAVSEGFYQDQLVNSLAVYLH